jgi:hypothetical protein
MVRRGGGVLTASALLVLGGAAPAAAKMPPFTLEAPRSSQAGTGIKVTVTVRQWDNPRGAFEDFPTSRLDGLLALAPARAVDGHGGLDETAGSYAPIGLTRTRSWVFTGKVTLPDTPGEYAIVAFPKFRYYPLEQAGYPAPRAVTVTPKDNGPRKAMRIDGSFWTVMTLALATMAVISLVGGAAIAWRRRSARASV